MSPGAPSPAAELGPASRTGLPPGAPGWVAAPASLPSPGCPRPPRARGPSAGRARPTGQRREAPAKVRKSSSGLEAPSGSTVGGFASPARPSVRLTRYRPVSFSARRASCLKEKTEPVPPKCRTAPRGAGTGRLRRRTPSPDYHRGENLPCHPRPKAPNGASSPSSPPATRLGGTMWMNQALRGEPFKLEGCGCVTSRLTAEIGIKPLHLPTVAAKSEEEERGSAPSCVALHTFISWAPFVLDVEKCKSSRWLRGRLKKLMIGDI